MKNLIRCLAGALALAMIIPTPQPAFSHGGGGWISVGGTM